MNGLSICTPVFNKCLFTESYLNDLSKLDINKHEIILVDNASTDNTKMVIDKWSKKIPNITYVRNKENKGFAFSSNQAFSIAKYKNIMFLNNDIKVINNLSNWPDIYLQALDRNPRQIISPTGGFIDPNKGFEFCYETDDGGRKINYLSGWMLCSTKETFDILVSNGNIGPFRSDLYSSYFEDSDLSFRARKLKLELTLMANNSVKHFGRITSKQLNIAKLYNESKSSFLKEWKNKC